MHQIFDCLKEKLSNKLFIIVLFSFLLKLLCWYLNPTLSRDGCLYLLIVQHWDIQNPLKLLEDLWIQPFLLFLMKSLQNIGFSAEMAGIIPNLGLGTFTPLLTYKIAHEITQRTDIALCSALLAAVNPSLNALSVKVQRDMIYLFFIGLVIWLILAGIRRQKWYFWLWGAVFTGIAVLIRLEAAEMLLFVPSVLLWLCFAKYLSWKKGVAYATLFFSVFFSCVFGLSSFLGSPTLLFQSYFSNCYTRISAVKSKLYPDIRSHKK